MDIDCDIFNVLQHQYHIKIDDLIEKTSASMTQGMISKLVSVLETTLSKLSRYDEGSLIGSILSFTVCSPPHRSSYCLDIVCAVMVSCV